MVRSALCILLLLCLAVAQYQLPIREDIKKVEHYAYRHKLILTHSGELWLSTFELWNREDIKCKFDMPPLADLYSDYSTGYIIYLVTDEEKLIGWDALKFVSILEHFGRSNLHHYQSYLSGRPYESDCELIQELDYQVDM